MIYLILETNEILKTACPIWDFQNPPTHSGLLEGSMYSIMRESHGIGLAAPQLGNLYRVFVMGDLEHSWTCVNPEILEKSIEEEIDVEGCLSFPNLHLKVKRSITIKVRYFNFDRKETIETLTGVWARCFQHELDHLNGVVFTTKVSKLVLDMAKRKRNKKIDNH
jgi:peptide deformylase